jgi:transposase
VEGGGERLEWQERVPVIRSLALAQPQSAGLTTRLAAAEAALRALTPPPGRGTRQLREEAALPTAGAALLARYPVTDRQPVPWERQEAAITRGVGRGRGGPDRPTRPAVKARSGITPVERDEAAIEPQRQRLGGRVQGTNIPVARRSRGQAVIHYRGGAGRERGFPVLQDRPLGIPPLDVQRDDPIVGLPRLLTRGRRWLTRGKRRGGGAWRKRGKAGRLGCGAAAAGNGATDGEALAAGVGAGRDHPDAGGDRGSSPLASHAADGFT